MNRIQDAITIKGKLDELGHIKMKNFLMSRNTHKRVKR